MNNIKINKNNDYSITEDYSQNELKTYKALFDIERYKLILLKALLPLMLVIATSLFLNPAKAAETEMEIKPLPNSFSHIVKKISPALVRVEFSIPDEEQGHNILPFMENLPIFEEQMLKLDDLTKKTEDTFKNLFPFNNLNIEIFPLNSANGFIISKDGYVITNHLQSPSASSKVKIYTKDNKILEGEVVGYDSLSFISLVKISSDEDEEFPFININEKASIENGDWILNIGMMPNGNSLLRSALISNINDDNSSNKSNNDDLYMVDLTVIPEMTGSPVLNINGKLIGMTSLMPGEMLNVNNSQANSRDIEVTEITNDVNISYVNPISKIAAIAEELKTKGKIARGWLGVGIQELTYDLANALGLKNSNGALVNNVGIGTPAEEADIQLGDVITMVNGNEVKGIKDLINMILKLDPGTSADIRIVRRGQEITKNITLAAMPKEMESPIMINETTDHNRYFIDNYGLKLQLDKENNVIIKSVKFGSIADRSGMGAGQRITMANNQQLTSVKDFYNIIQKLKKENKKYLIILLENHHYNSTFKTLPIK